MAVVARPVQEPAELPGGPRVHLRGLRLRFLGGGRLGLDGRVPGQQRNLIVERGPERRAEHHGDAADGPRRQRLPGPLALVVTAAGFLQLAVQRGQPRRGQRRQRHGADVGHDVIPQLLRYLAIVPGARRSPSSHVSRYAATGCLLGSIQSPLPALRAAPAARRRPPRGLATAGRWHRGGAAPGGVPSADWTSNLIPNWVPRLGRVLEDAAFTARAAAAGGHSSSPDSGLRGRFFLAPLRTFGGGIGSSKARAQPGGGSSTGKCGTSPSHWTVCSLPPQNQSPMHGQIQHRVSGRQDDQTIIGVGFQEPDERRFQRERQA